MATLSQQYSQARRSYNQWVKRLEASGYEIPAELRTLPERPKKVTPGSVRRVKALREKLKKVSVNVEGRNIQQQKNYERAVGRIQRREERRAKQPQKPSRKRPPEQKRPPAPEEVPPPTDRDVPPESDSYDQEADERDYAEYVIDKFIDDIYEAQEFYEMEGMTPQKQANVAEAVQYLVSLAEGWKRDPDKAYVMAKAIENAKYHGDYITDKDIYNVYYAKQFIMSLESYINYYDDGNVVTDEDRAAINNVKEALNKAANTPNYTEYQNDEDDEYFPDDFTGEW